MNEAQSLDIAHARIAELEADVFQWKLTADRWMTFAKDQAIGHVRQIVKMTDEGGRPPMEVTDVMRRTVRAMAGFGIKHSDICKAIGCSEPALYAHFRDELDNAIVEANARVRQIVKITDAKPSFPTRALSRSQQPVGLRTL